MKQKSVETLMSDHKLEKEQDSGEEQYYYLI